MAAQFMNQGVSCEEQNASKKPTEVYFFFNTEFNITAHRVLKMERRRIWNSSALAGT